MSRHAAHFRVKPRKGSPSRYVAFTRNGKYHFISTEQRDAARARKEAARIVSEHDAGSDCELCGGGGAPVLDGTTSLLSEAYIKELRRSRDERYISRAVTDLTYYIEPRWTHPMQITSETWKEAVLDWHTPIAPKEPLPEGRRKRRLSFGTIANLANTMRDFLRFCLARGAISAMPEIRSPTEKQKEKDRPVLLAMDEDQREAFLWALAIMGEKRAVLVYQALFETWMRKEACEAMTPRWVNFRDESITIPAAFTKSQKADKVIDLTPKAAEAIRAAMGEPVKLDEPIFGPFDFHQAWSRGGGIWGRALALAGVDPKGFTPHHMTRRTAATIGAEQPGASLSGIMAQGGWDTATAANRYMKPTLKAARAVTRRTR